jgi:hypothetical protein
MKMTISRHTLAAKSSKQLAEQLKVHSRLNLLPKSLKPSMW